MDEMEDAIIQRSMNFNSQSTPYKGHSDTDSSSNTESVNRKRNRDFNYNDFLCTSLNTMLEHEVIDLY